MPLVLTVIADERCDIDVQQESILQFISLLSTNSGRLTSLVLRAWWEVLLPHPELISPSLSRDFV